MPGVPSCRGVRHGFPGQLRLRVRFAAMAEPQRVITLEIDGVPVIITVEHETSETLAAQGFPAERAVYVTSWDAGQIDDTRSGWTPHR